MRILSYRLKYDFYGLIKLLICFAAVELAAIGFLFSERDPYELRQTLYLLFDLILPAMFSMVVLLVFGRDFTKENLSFVFSLPIKLWKLILLRYVRLLLLFLAACAPVFVLFLLRQQQLEPGLLTAGGVLRLLGELIPSSMGLAGLALLLLTVSRSPFIPSIIVFGIMLFDFCTFGKILGAVSPLANYYHEIETQALYLFNRIFYAAIGLIGPMCGWGVMLLRAKGILRRGDV